MSLDGMLVLAEMVACLRKAFFFPDNLFNCSATDPLAFCFVRNLDLIASLLLACYTLKT